MISSKKVTPVPPLLFALTLALALAVAALPAQAQLFPSAGDGGGLDLDIDDDPTAALIETLQLQESELSEQLAAYQERLPWIRERLEARRAAVREVLATTRAELARATPGDAREASLAAVLRHEDALASLDTLARVTERRFDALLEAISSVRSLRVGIEAGERAAERASVAAAEERLEEIEEGLATVDARLSALLESRDALQDQLRLDEIALDEARQALLDLEARARQRRSATDTQRTQAAPLATGVRDAARRVADAVAARLRGEALAGTRDAEITALRGALTALLLGGGRDASAAFTGAFAVRWQGAARWAVEGAGERSQRARDAAAGRVAQAADDAATGTNTSGRVGVSGTHAHRERAEAAVLEAEIDAELGRSRIDAANLDLELVRARLSALERREAIWTSALEDARDRAEGGILEQAPFAFGAAAVGALVDGVQAVAGRGEEVLPVILATEQPPPLGPLLRVLVVALLGALGFWSGRVATRRLERRAPEDGVEAVLVAAGLGALKPLPISLLALGAWLTEQIPPALGPLVALLAIAPPLAAAVLRAFSALFPREGTAVLAASEARYLRLVVRATVLAALLLETAVQVVRALGFEPLAVRPLQSAFLLTLALGWTLLLARRKTFAGLVYGSRAAAPGILRTTIVRLHPVLIALPMVSALIDAVGYRNLGAAIFGRGFVVLLALVITPWVHQRLHRAAKGVTGYPTGVGPLRLPPERAVLAYRVVAPVITLLVALVAFSLLASTWGGDTNVFRNVHGAFTYSIVSIGESNVTLLSILAFFVTLALAFVVSRWIIRFLEGRYYPLYDLDAGRRAAASTLITYLVIVVGVLVGLDVIGIGLGVFAVFAGIVGIGVGFGSQALASNFMSGLILQVGGPISVGDVIEVEGVMGRVTKISASSTLVTTQDNFVVILPNSALVGNPVTNWTKGERRVRMGVDVGVAYGSDVPKVARLLEEVAAEHSEIRQHPGPAARFEGFGDSSLDFRILAWIDDALDAPRIRSELRYRINEVFAENDIEIPFPQRDLHLRDSEGVLKLAAERGWRAWRAADDPDDGGSQDGAPSEGSPRDGVSGR
jgi:small-conductance mechanosensitive channel